MPISPVIPDWPAPGLVKAMVTTRTGGRSNGSFASLNLGLRSGDVSALVEQNRRRLAVMLPSPPCWLDQVHGSHVIPWSASAPLDPADGVYSHTRHQVCAVLSADCLPLLLCHRDGGWVAAVHCGWRGLSAGIIEQAISRLETAGTNILAWLGPAIGPRVYEVGEEVYQAFVSQHAVDSEAFQICRPGHWLADLYQLARNRLRRSGVDAVYGGTFCTYTERSRFYSYRRNPHCGRMASLIWLEE